jgi:hypothetical protein
MKKKDLLIIYLNEFNERFLLKGIKKYNCPSIKKILKLKKIKTFTSDKIQDINLDPWVQSVSINTGKPSRDHKIFKLGEPLKKNQVQIWDKLTKKKITCSVWGVMNSTLRENNYLNHYFPDPWNFTESTKPKNLMGLYYLPNYYAKNYLKYNILTVFNLSLIFFFTLISRINLFTFFKDSFFSLKIFIKRGFKNFILFFLFDLLFLNIFIKLNQKKKSLFSIIFLNSIAHYQHNNWNEVKNEKYFFLYVENIFSKILEIKKNFKSILILNGFSQKKIPVEYLLRPINPKNFLCKFIKIKRLEQDMTNGGFIFFKNKKDKNCAIKVLNLLTCFDKKIFFIKNYKTNKIFYKINLYSRKSLSELNSNSKKFLLKKNFYEKIKFPLNKKFKKKDISDYFIKNIKFVKTTGTHIPNGIIFYDKFDQFKNKLKIENHKIFDFVLNHFN